MDRHLPWRAAEEELQYPPQSCFDLKGDLTTGLVLTLFDGKKTNSSNLAEELLIDEVQLGIGELQ